MRAAAYIRVSTAAQAAEEKVSLRERRKDIEAFCAAKGYEIARARVPGHRLRGLKATLRLPEPGILRRA